MSGIEKTRRTGSYLDEPAALHASANPISSFESKLEVSSAARKSANLQQLSTLGLNGQILPVFRTIHVFYVLKCE